VTKFSSGQPGWPFAVGLKPKRHQKVRPPIQDVEIPVAYLHALNHIDPPAEQKLCLSSMTLLIARMYSDCFLPNVINPHTYWYNRSSCIKNRVRGLQLQLPSIFGQHLFDRSPI
jgi:hypothetical protein